MQGREDIESSIMLQELRWIEARALDTRLVAVTASFNLATGGRNFGLSLSEFNVILRIEAGGLAEEEGTLRPGDRMVAVNMKPINVGDSIKEAIGGVEQVTFVVARRVATDRGLQGRVAAATAASSTAAQNLKTPAEIAKEMKAQVQKEMKEMKAQVGSAVSDFARRFGKKDGGGTVSKAVADNSSPTPPDGDGGNDGSIGLDGAAMPSLDGNAAAAVGGGAATAQGGGAETSLVALAAGEEGDPESDATLRGNSLPPVVPPPPPPPDRSLVDGSGGGGGSGGGDGGGDGGGGGGSGSSGGGGGSGGVDLRKLGADVGKKLDRLFPGRRRSTSGQSAVPPPPRAAARPPVLADEADEAGESAVTGSGEAVEEAPPETSCGGGRGGAVWTFPSSNAADSAGAPIGDGTAGGDEAAMSLGEGVEGEETELVNETKTRQSSVGSSGGEEEWCADTAPDTAPLPRPHQALSAPRPLPPASQVLRGGERSQERCPCRWPSAQSARLPRPPQRYA